MEIHYERTMPCRYRVLLDKLRCRMEKTDDGYEFDFDYKDRYVSFVLSSDKDPFGCDIDLTAILLLPLLILLPYVVGIIFLIVYFAVNVERKQRRRYQQAADVNPTLRMRQSPIKGK